MAEAEFQYKTSKALKIWLCIVVAVLAMLFLQTRDYTQKGYKVVVCADKEAVGYHLLVDGKEASVLEDAGKHGLKGAVTWLKLTQGEHTVEFADSVGGKAVPQKINVTGKHYLRFDSGKSQESNASSLVD